MNQKSDSLLEILDVVKDNYAIVDSYLKANNVINRYQHPCCSISGGKDSDIMLDIVTKIDTKKRVKYVFFDTGIEYQATKDHLDYLEKRYGITIIREKADMPIPLAVKKYGQPFLSKNVSDMIYRLQKHNFQWEDDTYENLAKKYPNAKAALKWWTNYKDNDVDGMSRFSIRRNKLLKEFLMANPPQFLISNKCCYYAKKKPAHDFIEREHCDLMILGVRKAEGGIRSTAYKNCFTNNDDNDRDISQYRPLFYYCKQDEEIYDEIFNIKHSDCYCKYGLKRTGCVGCPYGRNLNEEIAIMEEFEPKVAKAAHNIFKDSYEYTKKYREFIEQYEAA